MISFSMSYGQKERSHNRSGVKEYLAGDYPDAELDFMKALEYDSTSFAANYNTASTLYKLGKYGEANEILAKLANNNESQEYLPDMLHNLGNNFMKQEMYDKAIEAYKNSLRLRPDDDETRYNLSYAQAKLKQQEQENEDNKDKDKQDEKNKDENQDQQDKEDQQQQQDQQQQNQDEKKDQPQPQENKELSKEDVERILQAIQQQEKDVKEKVDKEKAKVKKVKTEKDW